MPFGLSGALSTYARLDNMVLDGLPHDMVLPYLDTAIHTATLLEHLRAMDKVLMTMRKAGPMLQPDQCPMFQDQIDYLGHRVIKDGVSPIPGYVAVVKEWPMPTTRTAIRAFLEKVGYYRRFIKDYAAIVGPLYDATAYPKDDERSKKALDKGQPEVTLASMTDASGYGGLATSSVVPLPRRPVDLHHRAVLGLYQQHLGR